MNIPKDIDFGLDSFQRPKVLSQSESIAQYILNILLWKPGNLPGLPHIGLNMREMLYNFTDEFDSNILKEKIYEQCNELMPHIIGSNIYVSNVEHNGTSFFVLMIPISLDDGEHNIQYAFYNDTDNQIKYGYEIDQL